MALSLPDARQLSDDVLEALRLRALRGCELGYTEVAVADLLGLSGETVSCWWSAYAAGGLDALPTTAVADPRARAGLFLTRRPSTASNGSTHTVLKTWASQPPWGRAGRCRS
jgi:hypothetical protein